MLSKIAEHLDKPWRSRRYLLILSTLVALGLCVYSTVTEKDLKGQELLVGLVGVQTATYGITKAKNGTKEDI